MARSPAPRGRTSQGREPIAPADAVWLQDTPDNRMIINAVFVTDDLDIEPVRDLFARRVLDADGGARYPRFRKRVVYHRRRPYWQLDPDFDLARHIIPADVQKLAAESDLQEYISWAASQPLPEDRPLWQVQHIPQYADGASALVVRLHHSYADGIAIVPLLFDMMDEVRLDDRLHRPPVRPLASRLRTAVLAPLVGPMALLQRVAWRPDHHALHGPAPSGRKRVAWTRPFPLETVKRVKTRFGATVNDVLMACVSGGVGRYLEEREGHRVPYIRVSMPVNMRGDREPIRMENRFVAVPLTLPSPNDLVMRLAAVKRRMDALKSGLEPLVLYGAVNLFLSALPFGASRRLIDLFANKCTSVVTNVPGPTHDLTFAGRRLRTLMFWVPQRATIGVGISILSFAGTVRLGVIADTRLIEDPGRLVTAIEAEFADLERHLA
jgi:WS/DGAT/MGAT family acyltransferase